MHEWNIGDRVRVSDVMHQRYGSIGTVEQLGVKGGLCIRHPDGELLYHPWGYDIVREGDDGAELGSLPDRLRDAQEAAEEYWEAWQDALRRGDDASLDAAYEQTRRQLAEENAAKELEFRTNMEREWVEMKAERDRLREALKRYGEHIPGCPHRFDEVERLERGWVRGAPCTCGLTSALQTTT